MDDNVVKLNPTTTVTITVELPPETAALINKFVALNQHTTRNSHGAMSWDKLVTMLLEDVAAFMQPGEGDWRGAHMSLVMNEHGYRS